MGSVIASYICECNDDCNQGLSGKNTWSKPVKKQPETRPPLIEQEKAITSDSSQQVADSSEPLLTGLENCEDRNGDAEQACEDDVVADPAVPPPKSEAEEPPLKEELSDAEAPSQQELEATTVDSSPSDKPSSVNNLRFDVSVVKEEGEGYGLAHVPVEDGSNTLMVVALRDKGPIARWNHEQHRLGVDEKTVQRGDRIVAVGSITDDVNEMRCLLRQNSVMLTFERWPEIVVVTLVKRLPADKFGLSTDIMKSEDGVAALRVTHIGDGLMSDWNQAVCQSKRFHEIIMPFFEIVKLDEFADDAEKMQQALMAKDTVELTFTRPDPNVFHK